MPELQPSLEPVAGLGVPGLDNGYLAQMNEHPGGPAISASQAGPLVDPAWPSLLGTNATGRHPEAQSPMAYPLVRSAAGAGRTHVDNILASPFAPPVAVSARAWCRCPRRRQRRSWCSCPRRRPRRSCPRRRPRRSCPRRS